MIADRENPAERVYLDGELLDLCLTVWADDDRGMVEQMVLITGPDGRRYLKTDVVGQPVTVERRGEVRIFMPKRERIH